LSRSIFYLSLSCLVLVLAATPKRYEHVGWWDGVKHELGALKPLRPWLAHWRDGSPWKRAFGGANPGSTYVEPFDYFVKSLGGWVGPGAATRAHLAAAQRTLEHFDVVLLTERLQQGRSHADPTATARHLAPLRFLLAADLNSGSSSSSSSSSSSGHELKADDEPKRRLGARLLGGFGGGGTPSGNADLDAAARLELAAGNALDLELWAFAERLSDQRSAWAEAALLARQTPSPAADGAPDDLAACPLLSGPARSPFLGKLASLLGIHRPPGHKQ
jgi:hypothetical protein